MIKKIKNLPYITHKHVNIPYLTLYQIKIIGKYSHNA